jgi:hypothetical protein
MAATRRRKATPAQLRALKKARAALKRKRGGVKRRPAKKTTTARKRSLAAKKAAATRAAKARKRSLAAKKAAATRKKNATAKRRVKRNPPAKKKTTTRKRRSTVAKRKLPARTKSGRFKKTRKSPARKRKTTARKRRRVTSWTRKSVGKGKRRAVRTVTRAKFRMKRKAGKKAGYKTYRIRRRRTKTGKFGYSLVRANPVKTLKKGAIFFAGLLGMRVLNNAIKMYGTSKVAALSPVGKSDMTGKLLGCVPSLIGFGLATMVVPKLKLLKGETLEAVKLGASLALFDAVFTNVVVAALPPGNAKDLLGEYVPYDNRLGGYGYGAAPMMVTVPQAGLDEYVPDNRYGMSGFEVTEALADEEIDFMQRGGAGGVFQKSVFGS